MDESAMLNASWGKLYHTIRAWFTLTVQQTDAYFNDLAPYNSEIISSYSHINYIQQTGTKNIKSQHRQSLKFI